VARLPNLSHIAAMQKPKPISGLSDLEAIYHVKPTQASTAKVADRLTAEYRALLNASPFLILATSGPEGLDCSPRGDSHALVHIHDEKTLIIPDRRGNNRIDSLRNIIRDPRVALLFLIPGSGTTLRINGKAYLTAETEILEMLAVEGKTPRSCIVLEIEAVYFQCARAVLRADLWNPDRHVKPHTIPTPGQVLDAMTSGEIQSQKYDLEWPERAKASMW
jgi:uncharacterized protein